MPTRNVNLTDELDSFVLAKIESGRYENASEVVRAALRALEREEQQFEAKLAALRSAIDEGDTSGVVKGNSSPTPGGHSSFPRRNARVFL
jgi:antitoxin ParD1/3/4